MEDALARKIVMLSQRYEVIYHKNYAIKEMRAIKGGRYHMYQQQGKFNLKYHNKDLLEKYNH